MTDMVKKIAVWFFSVIICGILVGLIGNRIYYRYFERPCLSYTMDTFRMAYKDNHLRKNLKITINDKNVNELYITTISLINNGNTALGRNDFRAESDPIRIEGRHIESVFVDKINTTANSRVALKKRRGGMRVNFKWINPGDKIVIKVVHRNRTDNIRIRGSFQGISRITRMDGVNQPKYTTRHLVFASILSIIVAFFIAGISRRIWTIWPRHNFTKKKN
ncbi:hypothetical protein HDR61_01990 [bacterium]|nr:hypothetical protein [bacterium]